MVTHNYNFEKLTLFLFRLTAFHSHFSFSLNWEFSIIISDDAAMISSKYEFPCIGATDATF